jgi:anthranilate synthase/aminodeoxychorismate synthase-like glutamine amidotransferase
MTLRGEHLAQVRADFTEADDQDVHRGRRGYSLRPLILLLDNKDSFVWNLAQALGTLGADVHVVRSDRIDVDACGDYRALVVSPGPGAPPEAGISVQAIRRWSGRRPILGVCLGHQAIGAAFGASVSRGDPVHGRTSPVHHDGRGLFLGLDSPLEVCRYHSLYVRDLPPELLVTGRLANGECMALAHTTHPTYGVQFHPESFRSRLGPRLLANFVRIVDGWVAPASAVPATSKESA